MFLKNALVVFIGGGAGSAVRYAVNCATSHFCSAKFPLATFIVNIAGCLILGTLAQFFAPGKTVAPSENWRLLLAVGFCGGFTTFSTFSGEMLALLRDGNVALFAAYLALSVVLGIAAAYAGTLLVE